MKYQPSLMQLQFHYIESSTLQQTLSNLFFFFYIIYKIFDIVFRHHDRIILLCIYTSQSNDYLLLSGKWPLINSAWNATCMCVGVFLHPCQAHLGSVLLGMGGWSPLYCPGSCSSFAAFHACLLLMTESKWKDKHCVHSQVDVSECSAGFPTRLKFSDHIPCDISYRA